jgi:glycosyltransferase involved in cell wall biosynthesis
MTRPLVSVVTPVYNGAQFLDECIASVIGQSYSDWDYTILDNCSTDGSFDIAKRYADRDPRIRAIRKEEFVSQTKNLNRVLGYISPNSTYCKFVMADDWLFPNCLEEMVRVAEMDERVGIVGSYSMYQNRVQHFVAHSGLPYAKHPIFRGTDASRQYLLTDEWFLGSPTCLLYRSALVRQRSVFFNEKNQLCEDAEICLELMQEADFGFVFQLLTYNRRDNESVWTRQQTFHPLLLQAIVLLHKFGPSVLSSDEYAKRLDDLERQYYRHLASDALRRRGPEFWKFQRKALALAGLSIDERRLWRETTKVILRSLTNPGRSIENLWQRLR